jgi:hypothetical protein
MGGYEMARTMSGIGGWGWHLPYSLAVLILVFSAAWLALLVHELSHALIARLVCVRIWSISLGRGPLLYHGTIRGCVVRIALFPLHGEVRLHDRDAEAMGYRNPAAGFPHFEWLVGSWRAPLISSAGALGNLVAAKAVMAFWLSTPRLHAIGLMWTMAVFLVNAFMLLNLMPLRGFDGWRLALQAAAWRRRPVPATQ